MMPQGNKQIKLHAVSELEADPAEYGRILNDMLRHGGPLMPTPNWLMTEDVSQPAESYVLEEAYKFALSDAAFAKVSKLTNLMSAWVGGSQPPSTEEFFRYQRLLKNCDALGLWDKNVNSGAPLGRQDLGSLMDLNFIYGFAGPRNRRTRILEVGGGYGRLAEAAFNIFGNSIQYVIIDSVPASLYYSKKYLTLACPEARVGSYYDLNFKLSECDIAIIPAWHFERLNSFGYDICVNIESMQEMNQYHVDYYLNLFDSVAVEDAIIYLSNAHEYYFRGEFNYPKNWRKLLCSDTPRSNLCMDHPTEIFEKTKNNYSLPNQTCDAVHKYVIGGLR